MGPSGVVMSASAPCCPQLSAPSRSPRGGRSRQRRARCRQKSQCLRATRRDGRHQPGSCRTGEELFSENGCAAKRDCHLHRGRWVGKGPSILLASSDGWSVSYHGQTAKYTSNKEYYTAPMLPRDTLAWQSKCSGTLGPYLSMGTTEAALSTHSRVSEGPEIQSQAVLACCREKQQFALSLPSPV